MIKIKKLVSIMLITVLVSALLPVGAFADNDDPITIKFNVGSSSVQINGTYYTVPKTYLSEGTVLAPSDVFFKSLGAELTRRDNGSYNISYNNVSIDFTPGSKTCKVNGENITLSCAPQLKNGTVYVPFKYFAEKFGAAVNYNSASNLQTAYFADDGALKDLSFLTDSIKKSKVGDSYYNWSMNIPRGSRVSGGNFNSSYISIENTTRNIQLDIKITRTESETLSSYYEKVLDDPSEYLEGYSIADSRLAENAKYPYMEFNYTGTSSEPIVQRIYVTSKYIYSIILYYYGEYGTDEISGSQYYENMLDSFAVTFDKTQNIQDLTKIQYGKAIYNNYLKFSNGSKYYTWKVSLPPFWEEISYASENPLCAKVGARNNEYVEVKMDKSNGRSIVTAGEQRKSFLNANMNPELYKFVSAGSTEISGIKTYRIVYELTLGGKTYTYDEAYASAGGMLYSLCLKTPSDKYTDNKTVFEDIFTSFKPIDKFTSAFNKDLENYYSQLTKNRVGKYDYPTLYQNKMYKWSASIPGKWTKTGNQSSDFISFLDKDTGLSTAVEVVEKDADTASESDEDRFYFMSSILNNDGITLKNETNISEKGCSVKSYTYRWEDEENETFADVKFNVLENGKYYYCYFSIIPDEFKNQSNIETLNNVWNSFKLED